jgi:hypothetical protein
MTTQLNLDQAGPETVIDTLLELNPRFSCPRWAVLGPSYSGKTQFLRRFIENCNPGNNPRSPLPIYLDLKKLPLGREDQMYQSVFRALALACRGFSFQVSGDGPPDGTGRFESFIKDLLTKAKSRVALVVDHLDSTPHYFARSLIRRFGLMVDQEDLHPEFRNLCVLVAGRTSLFDLRQTGDSPFIDSNLIFPRRNGSLLLQYVKLDKGVAPTVLQDLHRETGGESLFVDLLFSEIDSARALTRRSIEAAIDRLLANPQRHDVFHQIALEIASSRELRSLVHDLLSTKGGRIVHRDSSPDVDRFCLSGVVVLHKEQSLSYYRFRNGIVERFVGKVLQDTARGLYFPPSARLSTVRESLNSSRDIYATMKELLSTWKDCVFQIPSPISTYFHIRYIDSDVEFWLDLQRQKSRESLAAEKLPPSVINAVSIANEETERLGAFGFDEETVSYAVPYARVEALLELVICFRGSIVMNLSESALAHWLRLLDDCWPWLAASALAEAGNHFAGELNQARAFAARMPTPDLVTRIHWMASEGILVDAPGECKIYHVEGSSQKIEKALSDVNQRCLKMMDGEPSAEEFGSDLRGIANQLLNFFENSPGFMDQLEKPGNFTFVSDESGLKIPIELLPVNTSHLGLESRIVRRLRDLGREPEPISFSAGLERLMETGKPLRVLLAGADPRNSLENLDNELTKLKERIEAGCQGVNLRCNVSLVQDATRAGLEKRLEDTNLGPFHIFHFCGHGARGRNPDESTLVLRGTTGADDAVSCEKLRLMLQNRVLWMAYLSCCYGAATRGSVGIEQQYVGTIHAVLSAGIPTAIGFRWAVSDKGAYALAGCFYEQLFAVGEAFNPSRAMWRARRSVAGDKTTRDAWASSLMVSQFAE